MEVVVLPAGTGRIKCPVCGGTSWMMCPSCQGSGKKPDAAHTPVEKDETQRCAKCGGRGIVKCNYPRCQDGWVRT